MFETRDQLLEKIRLGEDSLLECKAMTFAGETVRGPQRDDLANEFAAFANAHGGVVVLGVDDKTREITGIPPDRLGIAERFAHELCNDSIKPPLFARIELLKLSAGDGTEQPIIRIDVARSIFVHRSPGGYFYRVGSAKREMTPDYLVRLAQQRSQAGLIRFDEQVIHQANVDDLDAALVERFRTPRTTDEHDAFLRKLAMARDDDDGVLRPTVAGILLGSADPRGSLPHAYIQAVAYRGDGAPGDGDLSEYQLDAKDITGPLDQQVSDACRFVIRNMRVSASKTAGRIDMPQYDITAVFEALVNAVAHRDYSMHGSKIRLRLFASRLEIFSPGALSNTMTVESLAVRQSSRNEAITSLLAKCPVPADLSGMETSRSTLMDRRGEGVSIILERCEKLARRRPVFELPDESELKLTIFAASPETPEADAVTT